MLISTSRQITILFNHLHSGAQSLVRESRQLNGYGKYHTIRTRNEERSMLRAWKKGALGSEGLWGGELIHHGTCCLIHFPERAQDRGQWKPRMETGKQVRQSE